MEGGGGHAVEDGGSGGGGDLTEVEMPGNQTHPIVSLQVVHRIKTLFCDSTKNRFIFRLSHKDSSISPVRAPASQCRHGLNSDTVFF
jgi:hypothetical protein